MLPEMSRKDADIAYVAEKALQDRELLSETLKGLNSKEETFRYNCSKVLFHISRENGEELYPEWDYLAAFLRSVNSYHKMSAILILANLTNVDLHNKFEDTFNTFYGLLDDKSMVVAYYIASGSGKIVKAKPSLEPRITERLLDIDKTQHNSDRKDLIKAGIIEAFNEYFEDTAQKEKIIDFVKQQLKSSSPKTRKLAAAFLKKRN